MGGGGSEGPAHTHPHFLSVVLTFPTRNLIKMDLRWSISRVGEEEMRVFGSLFSISLLMCVLLGVSAVAAEKKNGAPIVLDTDVPVSDDPNDTERALQVGLLYLEACISAYPDMTAVEKFVAEKGFQPLPEAIARSRISGYPGQGWVRGQPDAADRVELILEDAPNQGCAIWAYDGDAGSYYMNAQLLLQMAGGASGNFTVTPFEGQLPPSPEHMPRRLYILKGPQLQGFNAATITVNKDPNGPFRARLSRIIR